MINQKKILCISHHKEVELGLLENFFLDNDFKLDVQKPLYNSEIINNFDNYSGIVILGGAMNVNDTKEFPGLKKELKFIKHLVYKDIPTIGICLGAQMIAKSQGSLVNPHKKKLVEIGYKDIYNKSGRIIFDNFPKKVFHWHSEGFDLPQNAEIVATNNTFKVQAFCLKDNIYGFQFHPEVIESMILSWNIKSAHMLNKSGATSTKNQLEEHKKYSDSVKVWFIGFLKSWIGIN